MISTAAICTQRYLDKENELHHAADAKPLKLLTPRGRMHLIPTETPPAAFASTVAGNNTSNPPLIKIMIELAVYPNLKT